MLVTKIQGISPKVMVLASLCVLSDASVFDRLDQASKMDGETLRKYFHSFIYEISKIYGPSFLNRRPNRGELGAIEGDS